MVGEGDRPGGALVVERHGTERIPLSERHGKVRSLFTLWFSSNVQINGFVTGTLAVILGLNLFWAIVAIVVGNLVGGVFVAYHSVQGPRMGVPQMLQSRAQFGLFGAALPQAIVVAMYLGFYVLGGVLAGDAIASLVHIPTWLGILIWNLAILVIAIYGHDMVHAWGRVATVISAVLFLALFVKFVGEVPSHYKPTAQSAGTFFLVLSVYVGWQITWAPYVSDYSRYLPEDTSAKKTFWYTYLGSAVGAAAVMVVGALAAIIAAAALNSNVPLFLADQFKAIYALVLLAVIVGGIPATVESPYGGFLSFWAIVSPSGTSAPPPRARALFALLFTLAGTVFSIAASGHLIQTANNVVLFLLYLLIPWTAINLVDYYLVRKGRYVVEDLFDAKGIYGAVNWWAIGIYILTCALEVLFMNTSLYEGPIAKDLGGADIAWMVGLGLASTLYYLAATTLRRQADPRYAAAATIGTAGAASPEPAQ